jgi:hypothetical protein
MGRRAVAGRDPLLEDAQLRGAIDPGDHHAGFDTGAPRLQGTICEIDDLHVIRPSSLRMRRSKEADLRHSC